MLDALGLAGNLQTAQLMRCILNEDAQGALTLLHQLYAGGKDMGAVLSALSTLGRDLLIRKTAPKGGAALLSGGYDSATLEELGTAADASRLIAILTTLQNTSAGLLRSTNLRTDAELCILKLCDQSLSGDWTALVSRVKKLESAVKALQERPIAAAPAAQEKRRSAATPVPASPVDDAPWEDAPPLPTDADDPGASSLTQDYDVPAPAQPAAPRRTVSAVPRDNTPPPPPVRETDECWPALLEQFKARLPMAKRAFLNMAGGVLEGDQLIVQCDNDLVKNTLSKDDVVEVLRQTASEFLGRSIAVRVVTKSASAQRPAAGGGEAAAPRAGSAPAPQPKQQADVDPLEHLLNKMQGFDNFKIQ